MYIEERQDKPGGPTDWAVVEINDDGEDVRIYYYASLHRG